MHAVLAYRENPENYVWPVQSLWRMHGYQVFMQWIQECQWEKSVQCQDMQEVMQRRLLCKIMLHELLLITSQDS